MVEAGSPSVMAAGHESTETIHIEKIKEVTSSVAVARLPSLEAGGPNILIDDM